MKKILSAVVALLLIASLAAGCGKTTTPSSSTNQSSNTENSIQYVDGTYKASFDYVDGHGWKPFLEVEVKDKKIVKVNFDYINPDGKLKSQDENYNKAMKAKAGTSPAEYTVKFNEGLVKTQNIDKVETVSGATHSFENFKQLAKALLDKAAKGDKSETVLFMNDTYTASDKDFDQYGWKAQVSITYENGKITKVVYEEFNKDGKKKSEDEQYNSQMKAKSGITMAEAAKKLADSLAASGDISKVDAVTGATATTAKFKELAQQAMSMRK